MKRLNAKLCGASLVALAFSLNTANVNAQTCTAAPSCEDLGFTKSSSDCAGKDALKCPFDMGKLYCPSDGEGNSGGDKGYCIKPEIGDVLYSDMTCSTLANLDKNKQIIGVIFSASRRLAVALEEKKLAWSAYFLEDIPDLENKSSLGRVMEDFSGASNTTTVLNYCKSKGKSCPAFEYVSTYKTAGTNEGDWYLPAYAELFKLYTNRDAVNTTLNQISGTNLCTKSLLLVLVVLRVQLY